MKNTILTSMLIIICHKIKRNEKLVHWSWNYPINWLRKDCLEKLFRKLLNNKIYNEKNNFWIIYSIIKSLKHFYKIIRWFCWNLQSFFIFFCKVIKLHLNLPKLEMFLNDVNWIFDKFLSMKICSLSNSI